MSDKLFKFPAVSKLWSSFEGNLTTYLSYEWTGDESIQVIEHNFMKFIHRYLLLTNKYGFFIPPKMVGQKKELIISTLNYIENQVGGETTFFDKWKALNYLYQDGKSSVGVIHPSIIFINIGNGIQKEIIVSFDPLINYHDWALINKPSSNDMYIDFRKAYKEQSIYVLLYFGLDIFFQKISNNKVKDFLEDQSLTDDDGVDNSELAYLNATRLNSFIRDLKDLCYEYGASQTSFETSFGTDLNQPYTENGVPIDGEIIYYEDIKDMIDDQYRI